MSGIDIEPWVYLTGFFFFPIPIDIGNQTVNLSSSAVIMSNSVWEGKSVQ